MGNEGKFLVVNVLFWTSGLILMLTAAISSYEYVNTVQDLLQIYDRDTDIWTLTSNIITCGSLVLVFTFVLFMIACCNPEVEWATKPTLPYTLFLIAMAVANLAFGIQSAVYKYTFDDGLELTLGNSLRNDYIAEQGVVEEAWDNVQLKLSCCGAKGPEDYSHIHFNETYVPSTCCKHMHEDDKSQPINETMCQFEANQLQHNQTINATFLITAGCYKEIATNLHDHLTVMIGITFAMFGLQLILVVVLCVVYKGYCRQRQSTPT